ncbi:MAG: thioesterase family protein [Tepidisphaeraceae bacterium]|jgi:acyl-CoA thioester hydrolase
MAEHTIQFRVRYPEVDQMGCVHHSRFLQYFEMGRVELLRRQGFSYADLEKAGVFFVVVRVDVRYKNPARYDDELSLTTRIVKQGTVRIDHEYVLKRGETVLAEGTSTIACVDRTGQIQQIPESMAGGVA